MIMAMNIILAVSFVPVWGILYFMIKNYEKPKKNVILGVTLPHVAHEDPVVKGMCSSFGRWLNMVMLPLLALLAPPFFMSSMGAAITWFMTWFVLVVVAPLTVFGIHREKLMSLKLERGWRSETAGLNLVDVRAAAVPPRKMSGIWFLLPLIISLLPIADALRAPHEGSLVFMYAMFSLMVALFWVFYHMIFNLRSEVFNDDLTLTMALTRVRRYNWSKFWLAAAWLTGALNVALWVFYENMTAFLIATLVYSLVLLAVAVKTEFAARFAQQKLTAGETGELYVDEDDLWIWGMFYYNPHNSRFLINDRFGIGMTVNLAKLSGKALMVFAALSIAISPFLGLWLWAEEATPVRLVLTQTELTARHTGDRYTIPLDTIESVELIEKMPFVIRKISGANFDNLYIGAFSVIDYGQPLLCTHPKNPPFLVVTAGGQSYIFNDADSGLTMEVYSQLLLQLVQ